MTAGGEDGRWEETSMMDRKGSRWYCTVVGKVRGRHESMDHPDNSIV